EAKGRTSLYDAVYAGIEKARQGHNSKKAVIILSDGQDNNSRYTIKEVKQLAKEADVMLYALGIVDLQSPNSIDQYGRWLLTDLTGVTGGRAFFPSNESELQNAIMYIALEMRHQYSIGFSPTTQADNKWHKLKIKVKPPKGIGYLSVRSRETYFAQK